MPLLQNLKSWFLSRWGIILIAKKNMCKVNVGMSLQNKFQPLTFKGETYFEVTYTHRPCTCFFWLLKWFPSGSRSMISGFAKGALITYLLGHSFSGNLCYITLILTQTEIKRPNSDIHFKFHQSDHLKMSLRLCDLWLKLISCIKIFS